jgi:hypothetical protein
MPSSVGFAEPWTTDALGHGFRTPPSGAARQQQSLDLDQYDLPGLVAEFP